jgi:hypothetical protein
MMALGAGFAIYFALRLASTRHPDTEAKIVYPLILSVIAMLGGLMRFLYRNKRNYFAELVEQRRSSVRDNKNKPRIIKGWN